MNTEATETAPPIYVVNDGHSDRLVQAPNQARALRHAAKDFKVRYASQIDLCTLIGKGVKVEVAAAGGAEDSGS